MVKRSDDHEREKERLSGKYDEKLQLYRNEIERLNSELQVLQDDIEERFKNIINSQSTHFKSIFDAYNHQYIEMKEKIDESLKTLVKFSAESDDAVYTIITQYKEMIKDVSKRIEETEQKNQYDITNMKKNLDGEKVKENEFKNGHLPHSVNLMEDGKFETWLGSIIKPDEKFYLASQSKEQLQTMLERAAAIGYESQVAEAFVIEDGIMQQEKINVDEFKKHEDDYTIVDVRNTLEVKEGKIFKNSISIPLAEVRNRVNEIPTDKPIVVHCAGGYRSAAASSLIHSKLNGSVKVFDLGEAIKQFQ